MDRETLARVRLLLADRIDDIVTTPGLPFAALDHGDRLRGGDRLPRVPMFRDALAATCQDLRLSHDDARLADAALFDVEPTP